MNDETTIIQVLNRIMYIIFENLLKFTFIRYTLYIVVWSDQNMGKMMRR